MEYPLIDVSDAKSTRERIMLVAVKLFAKQGYAATSMRDIANSVDIKPASLYNHFQTKEDIFDGVIDTVTKVYNDFYNRTDSRLERASCFEDILDILYEELLEVYHMFIYYGIAIISTEQFYREKARHAFQEVYMKQGIDYSTRLFTYCIEKNWVKDFDAFSAAVMFMNSVFSISLVRVHEDLGNATIFNASDMFARLREYMLSTVEVIEPNVSE